jgi:hypothetical protein
VETFLEGRARDVTGDGKIDAGADMFSSYAFHTRTRSARRWSITSR